VRPRPQLQQLPSFPSSTSLPQPQQQLLLRHAVLPSLAGGASPHPIASRRSTTLVVAAAKKVRKASSKGRNEDLLEQMVKGFKAPVLKEVLGTWQGLMENLTR
jgi:hypothetical protein